LERVTGPGLPGDGVKYGVLPASVHESA